MLVRKLVAVLESIERLPMFLYDTPGSSYGLQVSEVQRDSLVWTGCHEEERWLLFVQQGPGNDA